MATMTTTTAPVKHQVVDKLPKRIKNLKFGIQSNQDIVNQGVLEVSDRSMYDIEKGREPTKNGVLDKRLVSNLGYHKCLRRGYLTQLRFLGNF